MERSITLDRNVRRCSSRASRSSFDFETNVEITKFEEFGEGLFCVGSSETRDEL